MSTCCCGRPQPGIQGGQGRLETPRIYPGWPGRAGNPQGTSVSMLEEPLGMLLGSHRLHIHIPALWEHLCGVVG